MENFSNFKSNRFYSLEAKQAGTSEQEQEQEQQEDGECDSRWSPVGGRSLDVYQWSENGRRKTGGKIKSAKKSAAKTKEGEWDSK